MLYQAKEISQKPQYPNKATTCWFGQGARKKKEIVDKYGILDNTLSMIIKNKAKSERPGVPTEFQPDRKRQRTTKNIDVDQALFL